MAFITVPLGNGGPKAFMSSPHWSNSQKVSEEKKKRKLKEGGGWIQILTFFYFHTKVPKRRKKNECGRNIYPGLPFDIFLWIGFRGRTFKGSWSRVPKGASSRGPLAVPVIVVVVSMTGKWEQWLVMATNFIPLNWRRDTSHPLFEMSLLRSSSSSSSSVCPPSKYWFEKWIFHCSGEIGYFDGQFPVSFQSEDEGGGHQEADPRDDVQWNMSHWQEWQEEGQKTAPNEMWALKSH